MADRDFEGWSTQFSIGREVTYGTVPGSTASPFFGSIRAANINEESPVIQHRSKSSGRNVESNLPGRVICDGDIEVTPKNGLDLEYFFGTIRKGAVGDGTTTIVQADDDNEVKTGCSITPQSTPDMTVILSAAGTYDIGGSPFTTTLISDITMTAAHATLDRVDVISIKDAAATTEETVTAGTAAAVPVPDLASVPTDELILAFVYVRAATTTILASDIRHIFWAIESNTLPSFTAEDDYLNPDGTGTDDFIQLDLGAKINQIAYSITREQTDPVFWTVGLMCKNQQTKPAAVTASTITEYAGSFFLEWAQEMTIDGVSTFDLNEFSLTMTNNLKRKGTDGRFPAKMNPNNREYSATAKIDLKNPDQREKFLGAASATEAQDTLADITVKHTMKKENYEFIEFTFSTCNYNKTPTDAPLDDKVEMELDIAMSSAVAYIVEGTETYG